MSKIYLISEKTLKEDTFINDNIGGEMLNPSIAEAQDISLQEILGTKLLNKVLGLVETGDIKNDEYADYKALLDEYITPYLEWKVMSTIQIPLAYKMRNLGVVQTNDTNVYSAGLKDAQAIADYYDSKASFYSLRLSKYLHANHNKYPEYCSTDSCADFKSRPVFHNPIYLG